MHEGCVACTVHEEGRVGGLVTRLVFAGVEKEPAQGCMHEGCLGRRGPLGGAMSGWHGSCGRDSLRPRLVRDVFICRLRPKKMSLRTSAACICRAPFQMSARPFFLFR